METCRKEIYFISFAVKKYINFSNPSCIIIYLVYNEMEKISNAFFFYGDEDSLSFRSKV